MGEVKTTFSVGRSSRTPRYRLLEAPGPGRKSGEIVAVDYGFPWVMNAGLLGKSL